MSLQTKMYECACPNCHTTAKCICSGCGREFYCSSSCQKKDWKAHKSMCPILKRLSVNVQPYGEVMRIIEEIRSSNKIRVLEHLLSYADYQFGKEVPGKSYREREDRRVSNWKVDYYILHGIIDSTVRLYKENLSLTIISRDNAIFPYLERSLRLLNPWLIYFDSDANDRDDIMSEMQINALVYQLHHTEIAMAFVTANRTEFAKAEKHCERYLTYSRRFGPEGKEKTTLIFDALHMYSNLRLRQFDDESAKTFAEEGYNLVVTAYDPVHPQVQEAAGILIDILIGKGDLKDAWRFALITYGNLRNSKNGMDQEGDEMAKAAQNLAYVILQQDGDMIRAEELAREALRIRTLIYGSDHCIMGKNINILVRILMKQKKVGDETRLFLERALAIVVKNEKDGYEAASSNACLGEFYEILAEKTDKANSKLQQLLLVKSYYEEAHRILLKIFEPDHPDTADMSSRLEILVNMIKVLNVINASTK